MDSTLVRVGRMMPPVSVSLNGKYSPIGIVLFRINRNLNQIGAYLYLKQRMSRLRIYPTKENTIASGVYATYNSSQNAVADLWYGGGLTSEGDFAASISRHLLYFDISSLQQKIASGEINSALTVSYRLRMKNAVPSDKVLDKEQEFKKMQRAIAASFDIVAFPIDMAWDEGRGYDIIRERSLIRQMASPRLSGYSNWDRATTLNTWTEPGIFTDPTASTTNYATQHFAVGNEDLNIDISGMVNDWLSGGTNNGLAVAYTREYELMSSDTRYISSFFTHNTNSAFKPYMEVIFDEQVIMDDRMNMTNNRRGRLFLYTFSGNSAANYYSASTVNVLNSNNTPVHTGLIPTQMEKGVYYVDVFMSGASRGQKFKDVWQGVTFDPGYDAQDITQTFSIDDNYYTANQPSLNEYALDVYGISNGSILSNDEVIRVHCDLRVNYSLNPPDKSYRLLYRLVMNNQEEPIPWTPVNQTVMSGRRTNYFLMDTSWLLHNQTYSIQFKIEEMGTSRIMPFSTAFKVLRPF